MTRNIRKSALFVGLTFLFSWLMAILFFGLGGRLSTLGAFLMVGAYMFVPAIVAIVVQKYVYGEPIREPLGISWRLNRWFLVAWLLPPLFAFATLGVSLLFPGVGYSPEMSGMFERFGAMLTPEQLKQMEEQIAALPVHTIWISLAQGLIAGITINAVFGFGEELGWRGFLQRELEFLGFWPSSAVIGVIWGVWHAPIILQGHNYPQHPLVGVAMMTVFTLLLAPIFGYIRLRAKSVIAAAIAHGSLNATAGLAIMVLEGGSDLTTGATGLAGFIVLALLNIGIFFHQRTFKLESASSAEEA